MNEGALSDYIVAHSAALESAALAVDPSWKHSGLLARLLYGAQAQLLAMQSEGYLVAPATRSAGDRKTEKYTNWVEVMRLASFQYERFSMRKRARSEGLYATLLSLACTWDVYGQVEKILVPGCGPGRSVLDFARAYTKAMVTGLDYSYLSLLLGDSIVCGIDEVQLLRRDVLSEDDISEMLCIQGFGLKNADFYLCDLMNTELPTYDMIVCSNTLNLLPDHQAAVQKLCNALRSGGLLVFADLIGWRMDREPGRKILRNDKSICNAFEYAGLITLDTFNGVPYIEAESDDQETIYNEHFYVGRKK